jgi:hypothetical protein
MMEKVKALMASRSMEDLVKDFEVTEDMQISCELAEVRGWIMDELERRDEEAFWRWIEEGYSESPRKYFLGEAA